MLCKCHKVIVFQYFPTYLECELVVWKKLFNRKISNKLNYQKRKKSSLPVLFNLLIDMSTIMIREKKFWKATTNVKCLEFLIL